MTDLDVLVKFQQAVGAGYIAGPYAKASKAHHKPIYCWIARGWSEMEYVLMLLRPHLCVRRQEQIERFLSNPASPRGARKGNTNGRANKGRTVWKDRTHCKNGHDLSVVEVFTNSKGYKQCRQCNRDAALRSKMKRSG